jgi:Flp pilus assembly pilin Flp
VSVPQNDPTEQPASYELALIAQDVRRLIEGQHRIEKFLTGNGDPASGLLFRMAEMERRAKEETEAAKAHNARINGWVAAAIAASITSLVGLGIKVIWSGHSANAQQTK